MDDKTDKHRRFPSPAFPSHRIHTVDGQVGGLTCTLPHVTSEMVVVRRGGAERSGILNVPVVVVAMRNSRNL